MLIVFSGAFRYTCFVISICKERIFLKHSFFRLTAAVLTAVFLFTLTGCGSSGSNSFTWFVDTIPSNLDPQVASAASDVIACENLYSGLVRKNPDGEYEPALCERWEKSSDGRTYTFYLKDGLTYTAAKGTATEYAITAEDFVFAFRRMFRAETASPYAVEFSALENSAAVLAGQMPENALGVSASGPLTLVFRLSSPDDNFLEKLTLPGATPCDEEFFNSTRGTYGLTAATTLSSGSFYLYNWTSSGLFLRRASSGSLIDNLRLVQNTNNAGQSAAELIANEKMLRRAGRHRGRHLPDQPILLRHHLEPAVQLQQRVCLHRAPAGAGLRGPDGCRGAGFQPVHRCQRPCARGADRGRHRLPVRSRGRLPRRRGCPGAVSLSPAEHVHLRLQQGQPDGARRERDDPGGGDHQRRLAEGVLPFLLSGRGGRRHL